MKKYKNESTDEIIDSYEYNQLSSYEKLDYRECNDDGELIDDSKLNLDFE